MKSIVYFALFLMLLLTACTSKRGGNEFQHKLSRLDLHEDLSVSIDSLNALIGGSVGGIAVDSPGNIYLGDYEQAQIQVVSPDGRYLESIGQRGRGPGEFEWSTRLCISNKCRQYAYPGIRLKWQKDPEYIGQVYSSPHD